MVNKRPLIKIPLSRFDILLETLCAAGILFAWIYAIYHYSSLPETIPIHFKLDGTPDNFGSKVTMFLLPAIITLVCIGMTALNNHPHLFNYLQPITAENAEGEYRKATLMIRIIKMVIAVFAAVFTIEMVNAARQGQSKMPWWIIPLFMVCMFLPVVFSFIGPGRQHKKTV